MQALIEKLRRGLSQEELRMKEKMPSSTNLLIALKYGMAVQNFDILKDRRLYIPPEQKYRYLDLLQHEGLVRGVCFKKRTLLETVT